MSGQFTWSGALSSKAMAGGRTMKTLLLLTLVTLITAQNDTIDDVISNQPEAPTQSCCHYCRATGEYWAYPSTPWNITVSSWSVTDFHSPAAYFLSEQSTIRTKLVDGEYTVHYAGAPVTLQRTDLGDASFVLNQQFVQVDLGQMRDVTALTTQGGWYYDEENELLDRHESWVTKYAVSYVTSNNPDGTYAFLRHDGAIQVFTANFDVESNKLNSLPRTVKTRALRLHPLEAHTRHGHTNKALLRTGVVVCQNAGQCKMPRVNCEVADWSSWSSCDCSWEGCLQQRNRRIHRQPACQGHGCPHTRESQTCLPGEAPWIFKLKLAFILLVVILVLILVIVFVIIKIQKKKEAIVFDKHSDRTFERKVAKQTKRQQSAAVRSPSKTCLQVEEDHEMDEATENIVSPRQVQMEDQTMYDDSADQHPDHMMASMDTNNMIPRRRKQAPKDESFNYIDTGDDTPRPATYDEPPQPAVAAVGGGQLISAMKGKDPKKDKKKKKKVTVTVDLDGDDDDDDDF